MTIIRIAMERQRTYNQSAPGLSYRTLVPELILLVFLSLRDTFNLWPMKAVYLILVATLLLDYT